MKDTAVKKPGRACDETLRSNACEQILEAAASCFAEHGYADAIRSSSRKARLGKGTITAISPASRTFPGRADRVIAHDGERIDDAIQGH